MNYAPQEDLVARFQIRQIHRTALHTPPLSDRVSNHKRSSVSSSPRPTQDVNTGGGFDQTDSRNQSKLTSLRYFTSVNATSSSWIEQVETASWAIYTSLATPISPYSAFSQVRYLVTLLVAATYVLFFPLEFAFPSQHFDYVNGIVGFLLGLDALACPHQLREERRLHCKVTSRYRPPLPENSLRPRRFTCDPASCACAPRRNY